MANGGEGYEAERKGTIELVSNFIFKNLTPFHKRTTDIGFLNR